MKRVFRRLTIERLSSFSWISSTISTSPWHRNVYTGNIFWITWCSANEMRDLSSPELFYLFLSLRLYIGALLATRSRFLEPPVRSFYFIYYEPIFMCLEKVSFPKFQRWKIKKKKKSAYHIHPRALLLVNRRIKSPKVDDVFSLKGLQGPEFHRLRKFYSLFNLSLFEKGSHFS